MSAMCLCSVVVQYFFAECLCRRIVHCDCAVLLRRCLLMYVGWAGPHPPHLIPAQAHFQCPSFLCVVPVRCGCALPQRVAGCNSFGSLFICCFCRAWLWTISAQCAHAVWSCTLTRCLCRPCIPYIPQIPYKPHIPYTTCIAYTLRFHTDHTYHTHHTYRTYQTYRTWHT